jgi:hypothetical protein
MSAVQQCCSDSHHCVDKGHDYSPRGQGHELTGVQLESSVLTAMYMDHGDGHRPILGDQLTFHKQMLIS